MKHKFNVGDVLRSIEYPWCKCKVIGITHDCYEIIEPEKFWLKRFNPEKRADAYIKSVDKNHELDPEWMNKKIEKMLKGGNNGHKRTV